MRTLRIEWKHLDVNKGTCLRCSKTGKTLTQVMKDLRKEIEKKDVKISFVETKLSEDQIKHSNIILIDGKPLEEILCNAEVVENYCSSCSCITGGDTFCRTVSCQGEIFEEIPEKIIRLAVMKILNEKNGDT